MRLKWAAMSEGEKPKPMRQRCRQDVALFASWGIDMLKVDACSVQETPEVRCCLCNARVGALQPHVRPYLSHQVVVQRWAGLLNASGRRILFSDCHNGCMTDGKGPAWDPWCAVAANMWRNSGDIEVRAPMDGDSVVRP